MSIIDKILFKKYWKRRWFQTIIISIIVAFVFFKLGSIDSEKKYESLMSEHNKTLTRLETFEKLSKSNSEILNRIEQTIVGKEGFNKEDIEDFVYLEFGLTLNEIRGILRKSNDIGLSYYEIGLKNFILGDYEEALKNYYKALENNPNLPGIWYRIGNALSFLGRYNEAAEAYKKFGEKCEGKDCSAIYALIAYMEYAQANYSEAKVWIDKMDPLFLGGEYMFSEWSLTEIKADIFLANEYYQEAKELYEKLFQLLDYNVNFKFKGVEVFKNAGKGYCSAKAMLGELEENNRCIIINPSNNEILGEMVVNK